MTFVRPARAATRVTAQKPRSYQAYSFPAPSLGWRATDNLSMAVPGAAEILENWFPTAQGAVMRRGKLKRATLGLGGSPVRSIFSYVSGGNRLLFASNDDTIYDITSVHSPVNAVIVDDEDDILSTENDDMLGWGSTYGMERFSSDGGRWIVAQFQASSGQNYLVGVNGNSDGFVFDGVMFLPLVAGGVLELAYDAATDDFEEGETVTGGTSGATGIVYRVDADGTEGKLYLVEVTGGPFDDDEALTGSLIGSATANGVGAVMPGTNMTFNDGGGLTTADLSYVWLYKNRLFFIQRESSDVWYLPVGQVSGELKRFSLGGEISLGGNLVFGANWSQDVGDGLNALWTVFTSEGEVVVYQGIDPASANDWGQVGTYRVGKPLGDRCHVQIGGDLIVATDVAFVPLSQALSRDYSALPGSALSSPIEAEWPRQVSRRVGARWEGALWTDGQMVAIALPPYPGMPDGFLVMNSRTQKWGYFTNWAATCVHVFGGRMFFGAEDGCIYEANVTGSDDGAPYTASYLPVFDQLDAPGYKTVVQARPVVRSAHDVRVKMTTRVEYNTGLPTVPASTTPNEGSYWGAANWGAAVWGGVAEKSVQGGWQSQSGAGEVVSIVHQITSGDLVPLDVELVRTDVVFYVGDPIV